MKETRDTRVHFAWFNFSEVLEKVKLGGGDGNQKSALLEEWGHSLAGSTREPSRLLTMFYVLDLRRDYTGKN